MSYLNAAESLEGDIHVPAQSGVPASPYAHEGSHRLPIRLSLVRDTLEITRDSIEVNARLVGSGDDDTITVVVIRTPEGELVWDPIVVHGQIKMLFGFVPDTAFRAVAMLFRYNDTLAVG
jgi:hypothetical protein